MFNIFKSEKQLEKELRDWCYQDHMEGLDSVDDSDETDLESIKRYAYELNIEFLIKEIAAISYSKIQDAKMFKEMAGEPIDHRKQLHLIKSIRLCNAIAKKKNWKLLYSAYDVEIKKI